LKKAYAAFKQDPMAEWRAQVPQNMLSMKMPGSDKNNRRNDEKSGKMQRFFQRE
jgi:hypothetical protein